MNTIYRHSHQILGKIALKLVAEALKDRFAEDQRPLIMMSEDEGIFGRINSPRRCWVPSPLRGLLCSNKWSENMYTSSLLFALNSVK